MKDAARLIPEDAPEALAGLLRLWLGLDAPQAKP